jgi:hypothetical protein
MGEEFPSDNCGILRVVSVVALDGLQQMANMPPVASSWSTAGLAPLIAS